MDMPCNPAPMSIDMLNPGTADHCRDELEREINRIDARIEELEMRHREEVNQYDHVRLDLQRRRDMAMGALENDPSALMEVKAVPTYPEHGSPVPRSFDAGRG